MPLYACLLAFVAGDLISRRNGWTWVAAGIIAVFLALQLGGTAARAAQNTYGRRYVPAMEYLATHARSDELVMGSVATAFGVGLDRRLSTDNLLGYYSGTMPDWIVVNDFFCESFAQDRVNRQVIFRHAQWKNLLGDCPWGIVFQSPSFCIPWFRVYVQQYEPILVVRMRENVLAGLLVLASVRQAVSYVNEYSTSDLPPKASPDFDKTSARFIKHLAVDRPVRH